MIQEHNSGRFSRLNPNPQPSPFLGKTPTKFRVVGKKKKGKKKKV
jgi:hypothetical protein